MTNEVENKVAVSKNKNVVENIGCQIYFLLNQMCNLILD